MTNVAEQVKAIIADKLGIDEDQIVDTANFTNDLGADSLDVVELVMEFEKVFGIEISDDDAGDKITTVGEAIQYLEGRLSE